MATGLILTSPVYRIVTVADAPILGGKLYTYAAGTTTPLSVYTDSGLTVPAANPVVMDANGEAILYLGSSAYKLIEADANGVTIRTIDNVQGAYPTTALSDSRYAAINSPEPVLSSTYSTGVYSISPSTAISAYATGQSWIFTASSTLSDPPAKINVSAKGALTMKLAAGQVVPYGFIVAGEQYKITMKDATTPVLTAVSTAGMWVPNIAATVGSPVFIDLASFAPEDFNYTVSATVDGVDCYFTGGYNGSTVGDYNGPSKILTGTGTTMTFAEASTVAGFLKIRKKVLTYSTGAIVSTDQVITGFWIQQ